jgi:DNA-directed RNA polymerase specialized sigma24 family protein
LHSNQNLTNRIKPPFCVLAIKLISMDNKKLNAKLAQNNTYFEVDKTPQSQAKIHIRTTDDQTQMTELLQQKDAFALAQLYDDYGATLYGVVLRIVGSKEIAEQVIQDTFLKIWHKIASYDASKGRLYTWMLNIARNTAIDATRNSHFLNRKNTDCIEVLTDAFGGDCLNPETVGLREIVKGMDEKYTVLIDLIYFNQYTHQEAADVLELPLGTVKTRVRYALLELRKAFAS